MTDDEIDELSELGYDLNVNQDMHAMEGLTQLYLDAGMADDAERIQNLKDDLITYMQDTVYGETGYAINYNDTIGQWQFMGGQGEVSGQLIGYLSFDRHLPDDQYNQAIQDEIGVNPIAP